MDIQISDQLDRKQLLQCLDKALELLEEKGITSYGHTSLAMNIYHKSDIFHVKKSENEELVRLLVHYNDGNINVNEVTAESNYAIVREIESDAVKKKMVAKMMGLLCLGLSCWLLYVYIQYGSKEILNMIPFFRS